GAGTFGFGKSWLIYLSILPPINEAPATFSSVVRPVPPVTIVPAEPLRLFKSERSSSCASVLGALTGAAG
ncbi:MAG: hypothetical protein ACPHGY_06450, partial [Rhodospirillaceae bacterium]